MLDKKNFCIDQQLENLSFLLNELKGRDAEAGVKFLESLVMPSPEVLGFLEKEQSLKIRWVIYVLIAIGQGEHILLLDAGEDSYPALKMLCETLLSIEKFYLEIGGIIGYQKLVLELLKGCGNGQGSSPSPVTFHRPPAIDISFETDEVRRATLEGIQRLPELAEMYPLGGAADRFNLRSEITGEALPAATLSFCGKMLLERLIEDLQAREYLYYKLFSKVVTTPLGFMTSEEKNNHEQILKICEKKKWFGRPKESFFLFKQPLVPAMDRNGKWCLRAPLKLLLKPGGHGVIWRLARDQGVFHWLNKLERGKLLIRQINNLMAGVDHGLIAFLGVGFLLGKAFGFAACPRRLHADEGMNVLAERSIPDGYEYVLTNVEYCDFQKFQQLDIPEKEGGAYSKFPANTNILFADLLEVEKALDRCFLPGLVINFRKVRCIDGEQEVVRLESTMQNIADHLETAAPCNDKKEEIFLKSYLTYNLREKTIAPLKRELSTGSSSDTPEDCFQKMQENARDLLKNYCGFQLAEECLFFYHPALGPLYSIIAQKMRRSKMAFYAELKLEVAEVDCEELDLEGSLHIIASSPLGHSDGDLAAYSERCGKCILKRVKVKNQGIDATAKNIFWKEEIKRHASCRILIEEDGEFHAEDVILEGDLLIEVKRGEKVTAQMKEGSLYLAREPIQKPSWFWRYFVDQDARIQLKKAVNV